MSEHVEREHLGNWSVPFFANGPPVEVAKPVERDEGNNWTLAVVIFGSAVVSYAVAVGAIYLALTAVL